MVDTNEGAPGTTGADEAQTPAGPAPRACGWRVATLRPNAGGVWHLYGRLFTRKDQAQKWANQRSFAGPLTRALLEQKDGVVQVPDWMKLSEGPGATQATGARAQAIEE